MSSEKVLLDLDIADGIFSTLGTVNLVLKESGVSAADRRELMRQMVKLKVAINTTRGISSEKMGLAEKLFDV